MHQLFPNILDSEESFYTYDNSKKQERPTYSSYNRPYQYTYHNRQNYEHEPTYHFTNQRSDPNFGVKSSSPETEVRESPVLNYRQPIPKPEKAFPVNTDETSFENEVLKIGENSKQISPAFVEEPDIKNGFFSNANIQDFAGVTTTTTSTTSKTTLKKSIDALKSRNYDDQGRILQNFLLSQMTVAKYYSFSYRSLLKF